MKIGIGTPNSMHLAATTQPWEYALTGHELGELTSIADRLGFHRVSLGEHYVMTEEHFELSGDHYLHVPSMLSYFAARSERILLTSTLTILPLLHPLVHAKTWATIDWVSNGRAMPMFGIGWLKEEFDMMNVPFSERGKITDEYLAAWDAIFSQEKPEFVGQYVNFSGIGFSPRPIQPRMPYWLGGDAPAVLRRVAKFADGWSPFQTPPEKFGECMDYIRSQPDYHGRPIDLFYPIEMLLIGAHHEIKQDDRAAGNWDPQQMLDLVGWLADRGVTETIIPLPADLDGKNAYVERMHWVAQEIIAKVS